MKNEKKTMTDRMFGTSYVKDERIKTAMDEAGNHSFVFTLIVLWCFMVWSLLAKKTDAMMPSLIVFLLAGCFYLISLIRHGALSYKGESVQKPTSPLRKTIALIVSGAVFAGLNLFFKWFSDPVAFKEQLLANIIACLIMAALWVPLFFGLIKFSSWLSSRVTEKKASVE